VIEEGIGDTFLYWPRQFDIEFTAEIDIIKSSYTDDDRRNGLGIVSDAEI
jgi:hypothetical protein